MIEVRYQGVRILIDEKRMPELLRFMDEKFPPDPEKKEKADRRFAEMMAKRDG